MRIGIDARFLGTDGGIARYVAELVRGVCGVDQGEFNSRIHESTRILANTIVLFLKKDNWDKVEAGPGVEKVLADVHWYGLGEQIKMSGLIRSAKIDLMHFPHWNVPIGYRGPYVLTLHDLILRDFPTIRASTLRPLVFAIKYLGYRIVLGSAIRRAKTIIVPSEYVRERLAHYYPGAEKKTMVVYEGISNFKFQISNAGSYLLYVGNAYPHKNLERLLTAWKTDLVLVGDDHYFYPRLKKFSEKIGSQAKFFGRATDQELAQLYAGARAVVVPSLSEGFGLPGLEAMNVGVPVVAARASCLPEIYGDAAAWFDPEDEQDMARAIKTVLTDEPLRQTLITRGREQVKKYSWKKAAAETLDVYRFVAEGFSPPRRGTLKGSATDAYEKTFAKT